MNDFPFALFDTFALTYLAIIILVLIAQWKIFEKAGQPGWACIIPIYNFIVLMRVIGKPWWWLLLLLIPFVNIVLAIWSVNLLSKSFGKEEGFTIGLLLLPFIFYPILAFGNATYKGPAGNNFVALA
ncbi:DUF5684 domain-containing protein [Hydrotalea sp.]|uniref:DUF5684 domain-containing protein n=1 Tax=Hydrotalea sp. TaxID=2881279 RepID=UPI00260AFAA4|nr:DUF5684 domain-containing protein [Hydrotalea sp.]